MTEYTEDEIKNRKVTLFTNSGGKHWEATFEGMITHRDVQKFHRLLKVEFAKVVRRRSVTHMMQRRQTRTESQPTPTNNEKDQKDATSRIYKP